MGNANSTNQSLRSKGLFWFLMDSISGLVNQIRAQSILWKELATLTYDELENYLFELNQLSYSFKDRNGRSLLFVIRKNGRNENGNIGIFWKTQIEISCARISVAERNFTIIAVRNFNLKEFIKVYRTIKSDYEEMYKQVSLASTSQPDEVVDPTLETSVMKVANNVFDSCEDSLEECCICMERRPEILLPCAHSFCTPCIQEWSNNQRTCPVCRTLVEDSQDSWVLSEVPQPHEIFHEIEKTLALLVHD